jgi:hypothetical protein
MPYDNDFAPATVDATFLRLALSGPAGTGKTFTAIRFAIQLARRMGGKAAVLDTENNTANKYAKEREFRTATYPGGQPLYDVAVLSPPFTPERFIERMNRAVERGYAVLVIDSASHEWNGKGGMLEIVDQLRLKSGRTTDSFTPWATATPRHQKFIDALTSAPIHLIVTLRSKTAHEMVKEDGKTVVRNLGLQSIQRDGLEYEFDVVGELDWAHTLTFSKTRCSDLDGVTVAQPGAPVADILYEWLTIAAPLPETEDDYTPPVATTAAPPQIAPQPSESGPPSPVTAANSQVATPAPSSAAERLSSEIERQHASRPDPYADEAPPDSVPNAASGPRPYERTNPAAVAFDSLARRILPEPTPDPDAALPGFDEALAEGAELRAERAAAEAERVAAAQLEENPAAGEQRPEDVWASADAAERIVTSAADPLLRRNSELCIEATKALGRNGIGTQRAKIGMAAAAIQSANDVLQDRIENAARMDALRNHNLDIVTGKAPPEPIDIRTRQEATR